MISYVCQENFGKIINKFGYQIGDILESDLQMAINLITRHCLALKRIIKLVEDIRNLSTCIRNIRFVDCTRRANNLVDSIAKRAHISNSLFSVIIF